MLQIRLGMIAQVNVVEDVKSLVGVLQTVHVDVVMEILVVNLLWIVVVYVMVVLQVEPRIMMDQVDVMTVMVNVAELLLT
jgi:hypothetical protein